jgi:peptidoglycan/LPS O-acetylase OafA/YrhL
LQFLLHEITEIASSPTIKDKTQTPLTKRTVLNRDLTTCLGDKSRNNFTLIRLVSAGMVILSHSSPLSDPIYRLTDGNLYSSNIALPVFFFLSGLLVSQSLDQSRSWTNFLWRRFLRLYPAACFAILLCAFVVGPLVTSLPLRSYFSSPTLYGYASGCLLVRVYYLLPGVFDHSPIGPEVNSSLWTLSLELKLYLVLFLLGFVRNRKLWLILLLTTMAVLFICNTFFYQPVQQSLQRLLGPGFQLLPYSYFSIYFLIGMLFYRYRHRLTVTPLWLIGSLLICLLGAYSHCWQESLLLAIPFLTCFFAVYGTSAGHLLTPKADLSYGIYVWGYPIEQLVINYLHPNKEIFVFFWTILLVLPPAFFSWYAIERPALNLKKIVK